MGTPSSQTAQSKGLTDLLFTYDSDYVQLYRLLLFTAGILYLFFGYLALKLSLEPAPLCYQRIGLGTLWLLITLLTYISNPVRDRLHAITYASAYLILLHLTYLAYLGSFSFQYVVGLIVSLFFASTVFKKPKQLSSFLAINMVVIIATVYLSIEDSFSRLLLTYGFLIIGFFTFIILNLKLNILYKLKRSEELFKELFDENAEAVLLVNIDSGLIEDCNKQTTLLLDHGHKSHLLHTHINTYLHIPISQEEFKQIKEVCLERKVWHKELKVKRRKGKTFWAHLTVSLIHIGHKPFYVYKFIDITRQKEAQTHMRLLESVAINTSEAVMITEADLLDEPGPSIHYVNDAFTKMTGYTAEEAIGRSPRFLQGPKTDRTALDKVREAIQKKEQVEVEVINYKKDGTAFWVNFSISPMTDEEGNITHFVSVQRDTTERKRTLEKLAHSELRYRTLIENTREVFYSLSLDYKFIYVSSNWTTILGHNIQEVEGKSILEFVHPEDIKLCLDYLNKLHETDQVLPWIEYRIKEKNGNWKWHSSSLSLVRGKDNKPLYYVGVCHDLSERKKAEDLIKASLHEKEVLLKEIHHRVKNNMTVISSLLAVQANYIQDEHAKSLFEESRNRIKSMALIHDKLYQHESLANIEFSNYIEDLVRNITGSYNSQDTEITVELHTEKIYLEIVKAVPCGLIINEFFSNAYKHAFKGRDKGKITVVFKAIADSYLLEVSDNGIGLPEGFNIYSSSSLGMQLILALVDQVGGTLDILQHQGTTFRLLFKQ